MGNQEIKHIQNAFDTNWISTVGPQINKFEEVLAKYCKKENAAVLASGTSAIHLALRILGVQSDEFVICQSFTFSGSAFPIIYQNATPVFVDSEKETWNMDPNQLEETINSLPKKPKAIIPVHLYGMPYQVNEIHDIGQQYEIPIIEDAAEGLGSTYNNQPCGSFGAFNILSFNGNKIITTSGGGALLSNNEQWTQKARFLATQARDQAPHYQHSEIGYNYRMGNINAAIGLGQMEVLDARVTRRREIFETYQKELSHLEEIQFQPEAPYSKSNRWLSCLTTQSYEQREKIILALNAENIESRPLWKPMHLQPVFKDAEYFGGNVSEDLFNRGLCLPSGSNLTESEQEKIINLIKKVIYGG